MTAPLELADIATESCPATTLLAQNAACS